MNFDLVIDFKEDDEALRDAVVEKIRETYPQFSYNVMIDRDYVD